MRRSKLGWLVLAASLGVATHASAQTDEAAEPAATTAGVTPTGEATLRNAVVVVATGGVAGEIASPVCRDELTLQPTELASRDVWGGLGDDVFVVDTGGLFARHGVSRYLAQHDPGALAQLARRLGYHALAVSEADLGDRRELFLARARALRAAGIPMVASNLRCAAAGQEVCESVLDGTDGIPLATRGTERVAFLAYLDPSAAQRMSDDRVEGLHVEPIAEALARDVRAARARGATLVLASIDLGSGAEGAAQVLQLAANLDDDAKPDLVFSSEAGGQPLFARPATFRPALVSAPYRGAVELRVRRNVVTEGLDVLAIPSGESVTASPFVQLVDRVGIAYCDALGAPLAGGHLEADRDFDARAMAELAAGVMRERANADIAVINLDTIDRRWHPSREDALTPSDVLVAIQYDEALVSATVPGAWVARLAGVRAGHEELITLGLQPAALPLPVRILGRPIDLNAHYTVVTNRFLARGGDGLLPDGVEWTEVDGPRVRQSVLDYLGETRDDDPRDTLPDPAQRVEWQLRAQVDLTFTGSAIRDSGDYQEGPLVNARQLQFGLNTQLAWNALHPQASWENTITQTYTLAATATTSGFDEGTDQVLYRTSGNYRGFRARLDELYVPDLVAEGLLRTELTKQDPREVTLDDGTTELQPVDHFLTVRFTGGLQWRLMPKLRVRAVGGFELLDALSDEQRVALGGYGAQLLVDPWILLGAAPRTLTAQLTLDWFASDPGGRNRHLVQGLFDVKIQLTQLFALSFNVTLYGLKTRVRVDDVWEQRPFAFALQTTAGLRVSFVGRRAAR
ncbi:MAG: hypothetical protein KC586_14795 [Myxococcales bacterium]|nr:hypothetical protein [Myxococcales bacterium]